MYVCTRMYVCPYVRTYLCITYVCVYMHVLRMYIYACITYVCIHMYVCTYVGMYVCLHAGAYAPAYHTVIYTE